jgi:hypothetical protein
MLRLERGIKGVRLIALYLRYRETSAIILNIKAGVFADGLVSHIMLEPEGVEDEKVCYLAGIIDFTPGRLCC